jgi:hypothetical protein
MPPVSIGAPLQPYFVPLSKRDALCFFAVTATQRRNVLLKEIETDALLGDDGSNRCAREAGYDTVDCGQQQSRTKGPSGHYISRMHRAAPRKFLEMSPTARFRRWGPEVDYHACSRSGFSAWGHRQAREIGYERAAMAAPYPRSRRGCDAEAAESRASPPPRRLRGTAGRPRVPSARVAVPYS